MTLDDVKMAVDRVRDAAPCYPDEARTIKATLYRDVLQEIASDSANAQALAYEALECEEIQ